jgi:sugar lactone lactonase YvrE
LGSFLQDLAIDSHGQKIYIDDVSFWRKKPGLIVYDVETKKAWRALDRHPSVTPQDWIIRTPLKRMVFFGGLVAFKPGVDGIAIDPRDMYVYYATMSHDTLYRIEARYLNDSLLAEGDRIRHIEAFSKKPLNDGMIVDDKGRVLITDVEHNGVMRIDQNRTLQTFIRSEQIRWADNLCFGPDGALYIADSAIPDQVLEKKSAIEKKGPYFIYRVRPPERRASMP